MRGEEGSSASRIPVPASLPRRVGASRGEGRVLAVQGAPCVGYGERGALGTASPVRAVDGGAVGSLPLRGPRQLDVSSISSLESGVGGSGV